MEHQDAVGVLNSAQAMGDDQRGASQEQAVERVADEHFGLGVHARSGFVENEEARIVRQGAREADELSLADGKGCAALGDGGLDAGGKRADEGAEADFLESALDVGAVNPFRAETHVRFQRAGEEKGVLQNDAEMAAEILEVEAANIHTVEKDFAALNIVETQKKLDDGGLAGAGVADDGEGLPGSNAEGNVAEHPVFIGRVLPAAIGEPDIAEFDFAAGLLELQRLLRRSNRHGLVEQLEDALGGGHSRLQDIEFFAEVLDGTEETLRVHHEGKENAEIEPGGTGEHVQPAIPIQQRDGRKPQPFHHRIKQGESEDGGLVGVHVGAVQDGELLGGLGLAIEQLHDGHAADVFLKESVDAGNGRADAAVGIAHFVAEDPGGAHNQREDGKSHQSETPIDFQHDSGEEDQENRVVEHGGHAGSKQIVERVHIGGHARDQTPDGRTVVKTHRHALEMPEDFLAQVIHGLLAHALHHAHLEILEKKPRNQGAQEDEDNHQNPMEGRIPGDLLIQTGEKVRINGDVVEVGRNGLQRRNSERHEQRENHAPFVRPHIAEQAAREFRVVGFAQGLFFVRIAHARSSSSSSNCFW